MGEFTLKLAAKADLMEIFQYGIEHFGYERSEQFQNELIERFQLIANFPYRYRAVDYINPGYRRCVYRSHSIYFCMKENGVTIMRILKRQDLTKAFSKISN